MDAGHHDSRFPTEFDPAFYRANYSDLQGLSEDALRRHYDELGRSKGRRATAAADRKDFLACISAPTVGSILEIGPFANPVVRGSNVRYFDVLPTEDLRRRAASIGRDPVSVPHIEYVSPVGDLRVVDALFDVVVSCHSIEHQPDLVAHLLNVERILAPGGCYAVIVPDCRYCFDHYLPPSSIAEIIDAHYSERRVHTLASVIEHRAMTGHNNASRYWKEDPGTFSVEAAKVRRAIEAWKHSEGHYVDVHAWQFTPPSFRNIILLLHELNETALIPYRVYDTVCESLEFFAVLQRQA